MRLRDENRGAEKDGREERESTHARLLRIGVADAPRNRPSLVLRGQSRQVSHHASQTSATKITKITKAVHGGLRGRPLS
jgi:hypothetical protein